LAVDRRFCAEHTKADTTGLAATLAETALESANIAITDAADGITPLFDDVASREARFAVEPDGITN